MPETTPDDESSETGESSENTASATAERLERARVLAQQTVDQARGFADDLSNRDDSIGKTVRRISDTTSTVTSAVGKVAADATAIPLNAAQQVMLSDYRSSIDVLIEQAAEVITAQAARIDALESRIGRLETKDA